MKGVIGCRPSGSYVKVAEVESVKDKGLIIATSHEGLPLIAVIVRSS